jgi:hypothetical protein
MRDGKFGGVRNDAYDRPGRVFGPRGRRPETHREAYCGNQYQISVEMLPNVH